MWTVFDGCKSILIKSTVTTEKDPEVRRVEEVVRWKRGGRIFFFRPRVLRQGTEDE